MEEISLTFPKAVYGNLRTLIVAGAKSPHTDETAIMAAAQILQMMAAQIKEAAQPKSAANGQDHTAASN